MPVGLLLAVVSGIAWTGVDAFRKALAQHRGPIPIVVMLSLGQLPIFGVWFAFTGLGDGDLVAALPWAIASSVLNLGASLGFVRAVQISSLSRTVPFLSFTPVFTTSIAAVLLGERPSPWQLAGIGIVVAGATLMSVRRMRDAGGGSSPPRRGLERGSVIMIGVAIGWAATSSFDKRALDDVSIPGLALFQSAVILAVLLALLAARGRLAEVVPDRATARPLLGAVVCMGLASGLQYVAFTLTFVGLVETIKRALGGLMAVLLGRVVFSERVGPGELAAIGLMTGGASLLVFAT